MGAYGKTKSGRSTEKGAPGSDGANDMGRLQRKAVTGGHLCSEGGNEGHRE